MWIFKVGVVGGGFMGAEIAQVVTYAGLPVIVKDIDQQQLDLARETVEGIYQRRVDKGKMTASQMQEKLDLIDYTLDYDEFADVDIVIEAVPEVMEIKQQVYAEMDQVCPPDTIFASNTSALSITEMGAKTERPHRMIGMHFFSPAHVMKLVEVIAAPETDQDTVDTVEQFTQELRKIPVVVKECPGFLVNRMLGAYINEAMYALQEGAATAQEIDEALGRGGFGWPMGPFILIDFIGIDVCYHTSEYVRQFYGDRIKTPRILTELFKAKRYGDKAGAGFYVYGTGDFEPLEAIVQRLQASGDVETGTSFSVDRLMLAFCNEAARCAQEEIANVNDIDMACIAGVNMQVNRGGESVRMGPLEYVDEVGLDVVVQKLEALEQEFGDRFHPVDILYQKVRQGDLGKKTGRGFMEWTA
jgi:3-hydroxyacyl-CoA dehydrogenase/enoyl-CoA hydratase/3-hydroxybutyryl-CoA epimerase